MKKKGFLVLVLALIVAGGVFAQSGSNPFVGTWNGTGNAAGIGLTLVFTDTSLTMSSITGSGTGPYTRNGNTAIIRGIDGTNATAVVRGNNLTLTWGGSTFTLVRGGGTSTPNLDGTTWKGGNASNRYVLEFNSPDFNLTVDSVYGVMRTHRGTYSVSGSTVTFTYNENDDYSEFGTETATVSGNTLTYSYGLILTKQ